MTANVAPAEVAELHNHCMAGNWQAAQACQEKLMPLHKALFMEPSPSGAKYAYPYLGDVHQRVVCQFCLYHKQPKWQLKPRCAIYL